ncbi:response regulator [Moritella sp. F3]|uniref:response regulator n=1 Tax=Moritella sp. F3 TaxID=2718882 RepID=UPI0018E1916D|nr:response regulator [Moritella sp. F3]GIC77442.1 Fis family transcriptional regulator [Moritella sp. F1]GIC83365.1 Fis family transcriptional regulator [Moritella sp. F3]
MKRILAVDDSVSIREMVLFTLKQAGYQVDSAVDGVDGLAKAKTGHFDLIISDINMPRMDGISLISQLRNESAYKFTPILMLTTESGADKKMAGKSAGATGWIVKPFNPEKLIATVQKVLR